VAKPGPVRPSPARAPLPHTRAPLVSFSHLIFSRVVTSLSHLSLSLRGALGFGDGDRRSLDPRGELPLPSLSLPPPPFLPPLAARPPPARAPSPSRPPPRRAPSPPRPPPGEPPPRRPSLASPPRRAPPPHVSPSPPRPLPGERAPPRPARSVAPRLHALGRALSHTPARALARPCPALPEPVPRRPRAPRACTVRVLSRVRP
jgi:hypothetical protein